MKETEILGIHSVFSGSHRDGISDMNRLWLVEVYTMIMSCLYWKKNQGPIKLYCDKGFYDYVKKLRLLWLWDEIDYETVEKIYDEKSDMPHDVFWAYVKMMINSMQTRPFASLDIDLFINRPIDNTGEDIIFSHIENTDSDRDNIDNISNVVFYANYHEWEPYRHLFRNMTITNHACNVSILLVNNPQVSKDLINIADKFISVYDDNYTKSNVRLSSTVHASSPMTFIEQRLLHALLNSGKYTGKAILPTTYRSHIQFWDNPERLETDDGGITHLWGAKSVFSTDPPFRQSYTADIEEEFQRVFPKEWAKVNREQRIFLFSQR